MSEEDGSGGKTEGRKAKSDELLERTNEKGARLHDRISEVLGSPEGGGGEDEQGEEQSDEGQGEERQEQGGNG